jgi:hypothetical protein
VPANELAARAESLRKLAVPIIAIRPSGSFPDLAAARRACDHLQGELAPLGQFAGYIV